MSLKTIIKAVALICCVSVITALALIYTARLSNVYADISLPDGDTLSEKYPTVIIDAGHGGEDGGAVGVSGIYEKEINFKISMVLYELLRASGINAVLTRDKDILLYDPTTDYYGKKKVQDLARRLEIAREYENAIFVSIHQNAFSNPKYSGLQVYYSENDPSSSKLAQAIQDYAQKYIQKDNQRKTKPSNGNIFLLDKITSPAVLVECGFLSNPQECDRLENEEYQKQMAMIIYAAIVDYFAVLSE